MPSSISDSASVERRLARRRDGAGGQRDAERPGALVHLGGDGRDGGEVRALLGAGAGDLLHEHGGSHPAPPGRVEGVLHRDVVVDDDAGDLDALVGRELGGHLEVQDVAGVVLHDVQHAGAAVDRRGGGQHLVGHRGGEDLAGAGRVEHAVADVPAVQRLVPGAAAGDEADLARPRAARPGDNPVLQVDAKGGVRRGDARQGVGDDAVDRVDELLHDIAPLACRFRRAAFACQARVSREPAPGAPAIVVSARCPTVLAMLVGHTVRPLGEAVPREGRSTLPNVV